MWAFHKTKKCDAKTLISIVFSVYAFLHATITNSFISPPAYLQTNQPTNQPPHYIYEKERRYFVRKPGLIRCIVFGHCGQSNTKRCRIVPRPRFECKCCCVEHKYSCMYRKRGRAVTSHAKHETRACEKASCSLDQRVKRRCLHVPVVFRDENLYFVVQ